MMIEIRKPFAHVDREFTLIPNFAFDVVMPRVSGSSWKVFCTVWRLTRGWQKLEDDISFTQIMDKCEIKNRNTVSRSIKELEDLNYIIVTREHGKTNNFRINEDFEIPVSLVDNHVDNSDPVKHTSTVIEPDQYENRTSTSTEIVPVPVRKSYPQKKELKTPIKNNEKEKELVPVPEREPTEHQQMFDALATLTGMDYKIPVNRGRLNRASKELREAGYTIDDIRRFRDGWIQGFQWTKFRQRPSLAKIQEKIGEANAGSVTDRAIGLSGEFDAFIQH
jgi:hypothetical protein